VRVQLIKNGKKVTAFVPVRILCCLRSECIRVLRFGILLVRTTVALTLSTRMMKSSSPVSVAVVRPRVIFLVFDSRL
jgi:hypothetical protein